MINKAKKNEAINVVNDMWVSPTYTKDAAEAIKKILETELRFGVYYIINKGFCRWHEFASQIFSFLLLSPNIFPIKTI